DPSTNTPPISRFLRHRRPRRFWPRSEEGEPRASRNLGAPLNSQSRNAALDVETGQYKLSLEGRALSAVMRNVKSLLEYWGSKLSLSTIISMFTPPQTIGNRNVVRSPAVSLHPR